MTDLSQTPDPTAPRRLKRSRVLGLSGLMAGVGFTVSACGDAPAALPNADPVPAYTSVADCRATGDVSPEACETAFAEADRNARETGPRYATREDCEGQWGPDQCRELDQAGGGGSSFGPLVTGFFLGRALSGGGFGGGPLYQDRDGRFSNGRGGGYLSRDYSTGRTIVNRPDADVARQAPQRVQSRTAVVSRGGFGGGGRGYGG